MTEPLAPDLLDTNILVHLVCNNEIGRYRKRLFQQAITTGSLQELYPLPRCHQLAYCL